MALVPVGGAAPAEPAEVPRELPNGEEEAGKNWRSCRHLPVFFLGGSPLEETNA